MKRDATGDAGLATPGIAETTATATTNEVTGPKETAIDQLMLKVSVHSKILQVLLSDDNSEINTLTRQSTYEINKARGVSAEPNLLDNRHAAPLMLVPM